VYDEACPMRASGQLAGWVRDVDVWRTDVVRRRDGKRLEQRETWASKCLCPSASAMVGLYKTTAAQSATMRGITTRCWDVQVPSAQLRFVDGCGC